MTNRVYTPFVRELLRDELDKFLSDKECGNAII